MSRPTTTHVITSMGVVVGTYIRVYELVHDLVDSWFVDPVVTDYTIHRFRNGVLEDQNHPKWSSLEFLKKEIKNVESRAEEKPWKSTIISDNARAVLEVLSE